MPWLTSCQDTSRSSPVLRHRARLERDARALHALREGHHPDPMGVPPPPTALPASTAGPALEGGVLGRVGRLEGTERPVAGRPLALDDEPPPLVVLVGVAAVERVVHDWA